MKQPSVDLAVPTTDLFCRHLADPEPKFTFVDFVTSTGQVATALSACWMVHHFI